jgi:hypothetical protein
VSVVRVQPSSEKLIEFFLNVSSVNIIFVLAWFAKPSKLIFLHSIWGLTLKILPFLYESFHRSSLIPVLCSTLLYVDKLSTVGEACARSLSLSLWEARGFPRVLLLPMRNHGREVEKVRPCHLTLKGNS